jgi:hypothetical protein
MGKGVLQNADIQREVIADVHPCPRVQVAADPVSLLAIQNGVQRRALHEKLTGKGSSLIGISRRLTLGWKTGQKQGAKNVQNTAITYCSNDSDISRACDGYRVILDKV